MFNPIVPIKLNFRATFSQILKMCAGGMLRGLESFVEQSNVRGGLIIRKYQQSLAFSISRPPAGNLA